ncbi:MAG: nickel/cobalt transporter [Alphaproteobacteria bacterium]|nr:nickel/cobalt transporter [Alphaproteobacteria bacterium]MBU0797875.1 nickel/cobalt transporter [Alphaproteobacteria bacterium]MBU0886173.1 nickel/cobalt transporter [Alphaproteobacteria bacterium]MBU1812813.1 nickel/cobalt transporter [Alphaproteobacteria bacterium]
MRGVIIIALLLAAGLLLLPGDLLAQSPLMAPAAPAGGEPGVFARLLAQVARYQAELHRDMAGLVRAVQEGDALMPAFLLLGFSYLYGVFHAIGPGHGKAVLSAYLVGHDSRLKAGIGLAFTSSFVQALSAILLVIVLAIVLGATRFAIAEQVRVLEIVSYVLVIILGLVLAVRAWRGDTCCDHAHEPGHVHHHHDHHDHHDHDHAAHAAEQAKRGLRRFWAMVLAVGIRPCSGAVLILLFTLANGLFALGVAATFAMALGTAMTVAVLGIASVYGRRLALSFGTANTAWQDRVHRGLGVLGSLAVVGFGVLFLMATLQRSFPI